MLSNRFAARDLFLASTFLALLAAAPAVGQGVELEVGPLFDGQWAGPYMLGDLINDPSLVDPGLCTPNCPKVWAEITDATVLPPPLDSQLLLWCRRDLPHAGENENTEVPPKAVLPSVQYSFLWDPRSPNNLVPVSVPGPGDGTRELFCGFKAQTEDGHVFATAGWDADWWANPAGASIRGSDKTYVFDVETATWAPQLDMAKPRYYPSGLRDDQGRMFVLGGTDTNDPNGTTHETATIQGNAVTSWDSAAGPGQPGDPLLVPNNHFTDASANCATSHAYKAHAYPRIHLLGALGQAPGQAAPAPQVFRSFRDHSYLQYEECTPGGPGEAERFHKTDGIQMAPYPAPNPPLYVANSCHLLYFNDLGNPANNTPKEVVYVFGGSDDAAVDPDPESGDTQCNATITNQVWRMQDPSHSIPPTTWDFTGLDMTHPRQTCNAVILLNGKILIVGGFGWDDQQGTCVTQLAAELFRPEELYPGGTRWREVASQLHERNYHSVAVLDEFGRVHSLGGVGLEADGSALHDQPVPSWHSVETYSPSYFFKREPRPRIDSYPDPGQSEKIDYNAPFFVDATLWTTHAADDFWFALVAPGAATHAADFNQRYVMLKTQSVIQGDPSQPATVGLLGPETPTVAPPGWYLLTVVDKNRNPSVAKWVQVEDTP